MNEIKEFLTEQNLPLPNTILYPPLDKVNGHKLIRYEIDSDGMLAIVEGGGGLYEINWTLEQVRMCTI